MAQVDGFNGAITAIDDLFRMVEKMEDAEARAVPEEGEPMPAETHTDGADAVEEETTSHA